MLINIDWIRDFANISSDLSPKTIGEKFTLASAEVEDVLINEEYLEKICVAQVLEIEKHPEADSLNLVTFNLGEQGEKKVVCGASNVKVGMKTAFAPIGTTLPTGLTLTPKKIRGFLSEGMLCSEEELGMADSSEGIIELEDNAVLGESLQNYFKKKKIVLLDIDNKSLTHRPDMWGYLGMAREFACIFQTELKNPFNEEWSQKLLDKIKEASAKTSTPLNVKVDEDSSCLGYFGLSLNNITIQDSPDWIKERLISVGLRPISNIVDISNYVMLELGIPLHIFDRNRIEGDEVLIQSLKAQEEFETLDEQKRVLLEGDTVISDKAGPLVLAGIMGGLRSSVTSETKNIFIEVANWKAASVRKISTRLGLRTDSSQRYEKSLDSQSLKRTLFRTLELVLEFCPSAEIQGEVVYDGPNLEEFSPLMIVTKSSRITKILGHPVSDEQIDSILESLEFKVERKGDEMKVFVPSFRSTKDIEYEADIIEEIGRMIGYDNIDPLGPLLPVSPVSLDYSKSLMRKITDFLVFHGNAYELMTYPLEGDVFRKKINYPQVLGEQIEIINALSQESRFLRTSLISSHLKVACENAKNFSEFRFFEYGRVYLQREKSFSDERTHLGIVFYNENNSEFLNLANIVQRLMMANNIPGELVESHPKFKNEILNEGWEGVHPFEFLNIKIMGKMKGAISSLHPLLMKKLKLKGQLCFALIDLTDLQKNAPKEKLSYRPISKFPTSSFDWTIVAKRSDSVSKIISVAKKVKNKFLEEVKVSDIYKLSEEENAITLRATFVSAEGTFSGDQLAIWRDELVGVFEKENFLLKR